MKRTVKLQKVFEDHGGNLSQTSKFRQYFELYDKNKLDKANAWNYEAIDLLSAMNETQKVTNYRFWGQCLVVATKVFSLRVDSLYDDVFRLGSLFTRTGMTTV